MLQSPTPEQRHLGQTTQARDAKFSKLRQLLEAQLVFMRDMNDPLLDVQSRELASRAWDRLEERIRILRGRVKPGSKNVSVRMEAGAKRKVLAAMGLVPMPSPDPEPESDAPASAESSP